MKTSSSWGICRGTHATRTDRGRAETARARRAHFLIEGETWLYLLPRALVLALMLLAMLMTSPAPAMEPVELDVATRGIQLEQAAAAARFGAAQADNVNGRLRLLHAGHAPCSDRFDIGANIRWERAPPAEGTRPAPTGELNLADVLGRSRCDRRLPPGLTVTSTSAF